MKKKKLKNEEFLIHKIEQWCELAPDIPLEDFVGLPLVEIGTFIRTGYLDGASHLALHWQQLFEEAMNARDQTTADDS